MKPLTLSSVALYGSAFSQSPPGPCLAPTSEHSPRPSPQDQVTTVVPDVKWVASIKGRVHN